MRTNLIRCGVLAFSLALAVCATTPHLAATPPPIPFKLLVPAYFYPDGDGLKHWQNLINAAGKAHVVAIANPASGPGKTVDPAYTSVIKSAQAGKVTVIGYVSTNYAKRTAAEIKRDIDDWIKFYRTVQGIFFDEQTSDAALSDFYLDLTTYARKKINRAFTVTNPGTECSEEYFSKRVADTICIVEKGEGLEKYTPPVWATKYSASRFYGLGYGVSKPAGMQTSLKAAPQKHLGYVFVTDDKLPNPWDTLPPYWEAEVNLIKTLK